MEWRSEQPVDDRFEQEIMRRAAVSAAPVDDYPLLPDEDELLVQMVHKRLIQDIDIEALESLGTERATEAIYNAVRSITDDVAPGLFGQRRDLVVKRVVDDAVGLGPLEPIVKDPTVSEVMVNAPDEVYFERDGVIYFSALRFRDNEHIMRVIERIIAPLSRRVDESSPYVDARLPDGSRVNVIIPPLVPRSPTLTIRKFRPDKYTITDLVGNGTLTQQAAEFLRYCIQLRFNIVVSGGSGTGKTTLLNTLSSYIPEWERIITIESPLELKLQQRHVIACEARPPNIEGRNEVTQRDLLRNALRMRPDRIIIGEVRGPEAFDMMQAMNTGHEGSLTTVHANSPRDVLARIESMVLMAGLELPAFAIREQMASVLHLIIQLSRFPDGARRVTQVSEVVGIESQTVTMQEIMSFEVDSVDANGRINGTLRPTGIMPSFSDRFAKAGLPLDSILSREMSFAHGS
jgi:pilus assembly protein CpaF